MKYVSEEKYLGDIISGNGLAESVKATVQKRRGQVLRNIIEIRAVLEDCRSNSLGGVMLGIELWELAIIPYLLYNSETWTDIPVCTIALLNEIQLNFYRNILSTPKSCPIPALLWETGGMLMEHRIAKNKIMFYHHIMNLPEDSLAYQIAKMQESLAFPGLVGELWVYG